MKRILTYCAPLLITLNAFDIDLSNVQYIALINKSNDVIKGSFWEKQNSDDGMPLVIFRFKKGLKESQVLGK